MNARVPAAVPTSIGAAARASVGASVVAAVRVALLAAVLAAPATAPALALTLPPPASSLYERVDPGVAVAAPRIRIQLRAPEEQVRVGGTGAFRLLDGTTGAELWPERAAGPVLVVPKGGRPPGGGRLYRVQAGAWRDETTARTRAAELADRFGLEVDIAPDPSRGVFRLRVGRAESADALATVLGTVRAAGYRDAFLASEPKPAPPGAGAGLRLVDARWEARDAGAGRVLVVPRDGGRVTVEGRPYRGVVEVLLTPAGAVLAVNEVNLEDYLRGVVPEELGPGAFPELEALKAQAIAARTYAVANQGQYAADGYDICDTPRCQVYGGAASEAALSDRAVAETRGEVLVYEDRPINAMFTSTCGGHTEDVEVVFPEMTAPYLRGVPCRDDGAGVERRLARLEGQEPDADEAPGRDGEPDAFTLARLVAHGIVPRDAARRGWRDAPVHAGEVSAWLRALARAAGRPDPGTFDGAATRLALWNWLAPALGPPGDGGGTILPGDEDLVLQAADRAAIPRERRLLVAELLARGLIRTGPDGRLAPEGVPARGEALGWIARAAAFFDAAAPREATFAGADGRTVRLRDGSGTRAFTARAPELFFEAGGAWNRATRLELLPGDRVVYVAAGGERLALLGLRERRSTADDRASPKFRWVVAKDRATLEARLAQIAPVGRIDDIVVTRRGPSGRVATLEIRGSAGTAVTPGFRAQRALDLQETQFAVEVQREPDGALRRAVFSGRGWGHGVGLCQYGAFGMAQRGASARDILAHYYTGAGVVRLAP